MSMSSWYRIALPVIACLSSNAIAQSDEPQGLYLKPTFAISRLSDQNPTTTGIGARNGAAQVSLDNGFAYGLTLGHAYGNGLASEVGWEYRSNDSQTRLADGQRFDAGNYASNVFFLNGVYRVQRTGWQPYVGAGLTWIQEIDIDLETGGRELSFAGDGEVGWQAFAGLEFPLADQWDLQTEIRYGSAGRDLDLVGENQTGRFTGLDYVPVSLQLAVKYRF